MNKYFRYTYILLIIILIGSVKSSDKLPSPDDEQGDDDEDINFDTVVRELETLIEEKDHETSGDTVVSDNLMQHGLGQITGSGYTSQPPQPQPQPQDQSEYPQDERKEEKDDEYIDDENYFDERGRYVEGFKREWSLIKPQIHVLPFTLFLKRNSDGDLIPMNKSDLRLKTESDYYIKVEFVGNCSKIFHNKQFLWSKKEGHPYPVGLVYKKVYKLYNIILYNRILSFKFNELKWKMKVFNIPNNISFYSQDEGDNYVKMTAENYDVELCASDIFKFLFLNNINCTMIMMDDEVVFKKGSDKSIIKYVTYGLVLNSFRLFFNTKVIDCINDTGIWTCHICKTNKSRR
ncbi:Theileria-specific sub-telomeric protein, SVSP family [Theileria annulata]|uniref:Conserved Theileria-specific sub-telomeric protein, SVSP family n=1 Tax=Theileria annulata TaxID=5874 RepID=Q4UFX5_THEAN|nr:Theileria-specific sub-telomeric protein, SVSP family [Theileria annulata]CAI74014.1 conserved Theileria-specific sub-telomeric protein, SVSP family [Theileria annulata]|eukprot:XP_954694.1 conserved Theileria-specific sub-telomeric protein, SVSP family [Theileria annulata]